MQSNDNLTLKNRIREFRKERGISQEELAKMVGTSQNTISSLETYQYCPTAYLSGLICSALGRKWEECFYYEDNNDGG